MTAQKLPWKYTASDVVSENTIEQRGVAVTDVGHSGAAAITCCVGAENAVDHCRVAVVVVHSAAPS